MTQVRSVNSRPMLQELAVLGRRGLAEWAQPLTLVLIVVGYPILLVSALALGAPSKAVTATFRVGIVLLALAVVASAIRFPKRIYSGKWLVPLAGFWLLYGVRLMVDTGARNIALGRDVGEYVLFAVGACLIPIAAMLVRPSHQALTRCRDWLLALGLVAIAMVIAANTVSSDAQYIYAFAVGRFQLERLDSISFGHIGGSVALLSSWGLCVRDLKLRSAAYLTIAAAVGLLAIGLSASRGPVLAFVGPLAVLGVTGMVGARPGRTLAVTAIVVVTGVAAAFAIEATLGFSVVSRLESLQNLAADESSGIRLSLLRNAWGEFLAHPLLGSGLDERSTGWYPHNLVVESFMATGVFGGACFVLTLAGGASRTVGLALRSPSHGWILLLLVQQVIATQFSSSLYYASPLWAFLALGLSASTMRPGTQIPAPAPA